MDVAEIYRSCNLETDLDEFTDFFKYPVKIKNGNNSSEAYLFDKIQCCFTI